MQQNPLAESPVTLAYLEPLNKLCTPFKIDILHVRKGPGLARFLIASIIAILGSLIADALLVKIGTAVFPSTVGYVHFQFLDYARLTVLGVIIACVGWRMLTVFSFAPRWLYLRLAVVFTLALFAPDVWILIHGALFNAVIVLMAMHIAIAIVTYLAQVHLAPQHPIPS